MRRIRSAGFWFLLIALLAFVIFVECMADAGGSRDAIPVPTPSVSASGMKLGDWA